MKYKIINPVKPRKTASMNETVTKPELQIGYTFDSSVKVNTTEKINNINYTIVFIQLPDGYFIPMFLAYTNGGNGMTYVVEDTVVTLPPSTDPYKPKKVTVENEGGVYVATDFTKIS